MNDNDKILILTGSLGDGHNKAAQAILEAAELYHPGVETEVVDFLEWTHPHLHSVGTYCYMQWMKSLPSVYGYFYRKTRDDSLLSNWMKRMKSFSTDKMVKLLEEKRPTMVVCTFPVAAAAMSYLKSHGLTNVPTITVLTDYTVHSYWIHPCTDRYLVGSEHVKQKLLRYRIPEYRIAVTGIPIRQPFTQSYDRRLLRDKYRLEGSLPTVLVMGGGHGMIGKRLMSVLHRDEITVPMQFIFVCGRNEKLRLWLEHELSESETRHRVVVTGFVEHIHELMALSDLIVTKPGGLTVSEALALELPMMLYKPIPGQEQDNAAYLVGLGAAVEAKNTADLKHRLLQVVQDRSLLSDLRSNAKLGHLKKGAHDTLAAILETKAMTAPALHARKSNPTA